MIDRVKHLAQVERNRVLHNRIAGKYHRVHDDIFNPHEQGRIKEILSGVRASIAADAPLALDFGCGSGNMTRHLRGLGFRVVSADISDRFIDLLREEYRADPMVTPHLLKGDTQDDLGAYRFDVVCIYSVLHHLPDYLSTLQALASLIASGGYLYIDHEASDAFWRDEEKYRELQARTRMNKLRANWTKLLDWSWYATRYRMLRDPRYQPEGDIHVWKDDHIEWAQIRRIVAALGFEEIYSKDYLSYRPHYPSDVFQTYSSLTSDMHCSLFRR